MDYLEENIEIVREIKLPDKVIVGKRCYIARDINRVKMIIIQHDVNKISKMLMGSCVDYLDTYYIFANDFCDGIRIIFISDLRDISFFHYVKQPKSMLCRKLVKKFIEEENFEDYEYKWLPKCVMCQTIENIITCEYVYNIFNTTFFFYILYGAQTVQKCFR